MASQGEGVAYVRPSSSVDFGRFGMATESRLAQPMLQKLLRYLAT